MARKSDIPGRIITAALELAVSDGWRNVSLADIAARAGLTLAELHRAFPSKVFILTGFLRRIDQQVLAGGNGNDGDSARDRLFDVVMRRFDALAPHKEAVAAILRDAAFDPAAGLIVVPRFFHSMAWMVEAAGLSSAGLGGLVRTQGLAAIYINAFRVWLDDDTSDMGLTMAALDKGLGRADRIAGLCFPCRRAAPAAPAETETGG